MRAVRRGQADALARLRKNHLRWAQVEDSAVRQEMALHDAQFVIAREQGFASWTKLKAYAQSSPQARHTRLFVPDMQWIEGRVHGLLRTRQSEVPAALEQIREWHPRFSGCSDEEIRQAPFTEEDARLVYAREHGFDTWDELTQRVNLLASDASAEATEPFLAAFRSLQSGDVAALNALLRRNPRLAQERGTNGNTLLNLAVSIAARADRSVGLALIDALVAAGADVNDSNDRGWTPLHQAAYSNQNDAAAVLIHSGADLDAEAHGSGGTPLVVALFWGIARWPICWAGIPSRQAIYALRPAWAIESSWSTASAERRSSLPKLVRARGFYRPHSGFPDWRPSANPQEVLDEALVWACKSGRTEVLPRLVQAGARLDADPYRGTPLIWAAVCNRIETVEWLIDHGATIDRQATFGGLTHGQGVTALHMASQCGHLPLVQLLIQRGTNPAIRDDLYHSDAIGAANYFGKIAVRDYLSGLAR